MYIERVNALINYKGQEQNTKVKRTKPHIEIKITNDINHKNTSKTRKIMNYAILLAGLMLLGRIVYKEGWSGVEKAIDRTPHV